MRGKPLHIWLPVFIFVSLAGMSQVLKACFIQLPCLHVFEQYIDMYKPVHSQLLIKQAGPFHILNQLLIKCLNSKHQLL